MTEESAALPGQSRPIGKGQDDETLAHPVRPAAATFADFRAGHIDRVYRYILVRVGDAHVAEDLTSETFLAALEHLPRYRGASSLIGWVLGIARHKTADYFRGRRSLLPLDAVSELASGDPSPPQVAERRWQLEQVARVLRTLTPNRADALALHVFADLEIAEVSRILGKSDAAVRMLFYRAVQDVKARLAATEEEDHDRE